jgi:YD repeat-containing protein
MAAYAQKKVNGSECTCDERGLITHLRDGQGRTWTFQYHGERLLRFTDPANNVWANRDGRWAPERVMAGVATPKGVAINHSTGEIRVEDNVRLTVYLPDGTTQIQVTQIIDDVAVRVRFIEYPTRPNRSFVVVENRGGTEYVTWIQDAHLKLFKLEYEQGKLVRYIDMAAKPSITWCAQRDAAGNIASWDGVQKGTDKPMGAMHPVLQSVELNGNRHFRSVNGAQIVVDPSGAAFAPKTSTTQTESQRTFVNAFQTAHLNF